MIKKGKPNKTQRQGVRESSFIVTNEAYPAEAKLY